eukprot:TRINITY_DN7364_c0_g1_i1.p1 TRINITY_DN7364_c0_g1~~TRINITY_DN7364_c0_g1_i1.p1  ORF type:complete len:210 (-),score=48.61 TRINITY_DN7364_c0_g1_i1:150-779(-)
MLNMKRTGEQAYSRAEKINAELFTLTYGSIVAQLMKDYEDVNEVNKQLEKMGYNIGLRLIDEFLAKSQIPRCRTLRETAEAISKIGFKMFLGVTATVSNWSQDELEFSLLLDENPLTDFVELPHHDAEFDSRDENQTENLSSENSEKNSKIPLLYYCNLLCGVIRGSLEMVQMKVECKFRRCVLLGDSVSEIRVVLKEVLHDELPPGDD